jgi:V8-like Glu-specific endopeptidase
MTRILRTALPAVAALLLLAQSGAAAASPGGGVRRTVGVSPGQARKIAAYWTPARMRSARPLGRHGEALPRATMPAATASARVVRSPTAYPYVTAGRIFLKSRRVKAFCSGVAVDTPSRRLILTAGHCLSVREGFARHPEATKYLEFVPAYDRGQAPFGKFVMQAAYVMGAWKRSESPNYDFGAVLTYPNAAGQNVADAVGGGAEISLNPPRRQEYTIVGYPGFNQKRMRVCDGEYSGRNPFSRGLDGPAQSLAACYLMPGSSGGPWFVGEPPQLVGLTSETVQLRPFERYLSSPYFGTVNLGALLARL